MTFQHRAGVSPHTSSYDLAETCVFGKQLLGPFLCGLVSLPRLPLLRTYGVNLPSSLTTLLPLVLGFSPHPPVSVCGTGTFALNSGFSRQCEIIDFGTVISLPVTPQKRKAYLTTLLSSNAWTHISCSALRLSYCVPASFKQARAVQEYQPVVHRLRLSASS